MYEMFKDVHSTTSRRSHIDSSSVSHGRNAEHTSFKDSHYVHCRQCGFMCNIDRDIRPGARSGDGISITEDAFNTHGTSGAWGDYKWGSGIWGGTGLDTLRDEPVVGGGCPMCGSYLYV